MVASNKALQRAWMPEGTSRILDVRSLATDQRRLVDLLRPGQRVLDVGCGTGAITAQIAPVIAPGGCVVGVDLSPHLLQHAQRMHQKVPHVSFTLADLYHLPFGKVFDLVSAARVLQWLTAPLQALQALHATMVTHGRLVVLDYNHEKVQWQPEPPVGMRHFYAAFLRWRAEAGMDNAIADQLAPLLHRAGFVAVQETPQHEITTRQDADFTTRLGIWAEVAATRGHQMVADGFLSETQRACAEAAYRRWVQSEAESQTLYLLAVEGSVS